MTSPSDLTSILQGGLAKQIYKGLKNLFYSATITRDVVSTTSPAYDPPAPTQTTYTCKAIVEDYKDYYRLNELVQSNDRRVIILAQSLSTVPLPGDRITIRSQTFTVVNVTTDPAQATWECQGRIA